jgi:predicted metal-binding transcription factor (methanogenesis marker protein 9)
MKMSVDLSREIYNELKRFINVVDRDEAAETLVSVLIDNDISADDIKDAFKGEADIKRALTSYLKDHLDEEEEDDYDDEDDDEYEN